MKNKINNILLNLSELFLVLYIIIGFLFIISIHHTTLYQDDILDNVKEIERQKPYVYNVTEYDTQDLKDSIEKIENLSNNLDTFKTKKSMSSILISAFLGVDQNYYNYEDMKKIEDELVNYYRLRVKKIDEEFLFTLKDLYDSHDVFILNVLKNSGYIAISEGRILNMKYLNEYSNTINILEKVLLFSIFIFFITIPIKKEDDIESEKDIGGN